MNRLRWLPACAVLLATTIAQAQTALPPEINLFEESANPRETAWRVSMGAGPRASPYAQILFFHDKRQLHGELVEITPDEILWRRPDIREVMHFPRNEVRSITMIPPGPEPENTLFGGYIPAPKDDPATSPMKAVPATLQLADGDWLFGDVRSTDGQSFACQLDEHTRLALPRAKIAWIYFGAEPAAGWGCAGSAWEMERWLPAGVEWQTTGHTLSAGGTEWIGRKMAPQKCFEVAFEFPEDSGALTHLWLQPFDPQMLAFGPGTALLEFGKDKLARVLFRDKCVWEVTPFPPKARSEQGPVQYRVFFDVTAQRVAVRRNGHDLGDWKFPAPENPQTPAELARDLRIRGIMFDHWNSNGLVKLNWLRIRPWNGVLPVEGEEDRGQDWLRAGDQAAVGGKLESVTEGKLVFAGKSHPRGTGTRIDFSNSPPALTEPEVKIKLGNSGGFTARKFVLHEGKVHCETGFAAALELPGGALQTITFCAPPAPPASAGDLLVFKNGDELRGKALAATAGGPLRWELDRGGQLEIQPGRIAGLRLAGDFEKADGKDAGAIVELRNGEKLRGKMVALDDKQLNIEHSQLGTLALDRRALWRLYLSPERTAVDGACEPVEWMRCSAESRQHNEMSPAFDDRSWIYLDGMYVRRDPIDGFSSSPRLARALDPALERFEVRFDVHNLTPEFNQVYMELFNKEGGTVLQVAVTEHGANLGVLAENGIDLTWHPVEFEQTSTDLITPHRAVRLFVDLQTGVSDLVVNGTTVVHIGPHPGKRFVPSGLHILPGASSNSLTVLSDLWIGPWNGEMPAKSAAPKTGLLNGDVLPAAPKELRNEQFSIETELGTLEIPLAKTAIADFGGDLLTTRPTARVRLRDGTALNVDAFDWNRQELTFHSATWGDSHLPAGVVSELVYAPVQLHPPLVSAAGHLKDGEGEAQPPPACP